MKKLWRLLYSSAIALAFAICAEKSVTKAMGSGDHFHQEHRGTHLALNAGKKWESDEPLRRGMDKIKIALETEIKAIHAGTLKSERYVMIGEEVTRSVELIFQNCKLKPEADSVLHLILAKIIGGASKMKNKGQLTEQSAGAAEVAIALQQYGDFFRHSGWKPIEH